MHRCTNAHARRCVPPSRLNKEEIDRPRRPPWAPPPSKLVTNPKRTEAHLAGLTVPNHRLREQRGGMAACSAPQKQFYPFKAVAAGVFPTLRFSSSANRPSPTRSRRTRTAAARLYSAVCWRREACLALTGAGTGMRAGPMQTRR